ncbi:MAG: bifunctional diaminohydroxyphosphoribosylaminopyrimidine deaminase/5-amino-6-(5-phosphoribosylamino)uracil reductase RibD [Gammaproteobacteria bacterium]
MTMNTPSDNMLLALKLAERGRLSVSPNPMVGCVIVKNDKIIGQGYHQRAGEPHAEVHALQEAGADANGATVYVTLEPCCHQGRTPPCTDALIKAGIKKVYVACADPNPLVAKKGIQQLQAAGIAVELGLHADKATTLNEIFFHFITHQRPFVIAKWAMSLDGKTITHAHDSRSISSAASQTDAHELRQQVDAILIGANTARHDNPLLTVRLSNETLSKHPIRLILSSDGNLPLDLNIFKPDLPSKTILVTSDKTNTTKFTQHNIDVIKLPLNDHGQINLSSLLDKLGQMHITSLLVEGGMKVHEQFFAENLVNKVSIYIAPVIIGSLERKQAVILEDYQKIASDIHIVASCKENINV